MASIGASAFLSCSAVPVPRRAEDGLLAPGFKNKPGSSELYEKLVVLRGYSWSGSTMLSPQRARDAVPSSVLSLPGSIPELG